MAEATLKHSKDQLATEKKNQKTLQKAFDEDQALLEAKKGEVEERKGAYVSLQEQSKAAEKAVHVAQQRFQAVTAGLSSSADGQEETLAAQKIGMLCLKHAFVNKAHTQPLISAYSGKSLQVYVVEPLSLLTLNGLFNAYRISSNNSAPLTICHPLPNCGE